MLEQHLYVNAAYTEEQAVQFGTSRISAVGVTLSLRRGTLSLNAIHNMATKSTTGAQLVYSVPLDALRLLTSSSESRAGTISSTTELSQRLPDAGVGLAFRADNAVGSNAGEALSQTQQDDSGTRTLNLTHLGGVQTYSAAIGGAISFFGGQTFLSRTVSDGYALAKLPGYPGVRMYVNNVQEGTTNERGDVVLSNLLSYQDNTVSIEPSDLPLTANVENSRLVVVPFAHSPVVLKFPTAPAGGVLFSVVQEDGSVMPPGSTVKLGKQSWPVADGGQVYVSNLQVGEHELTVVRERATCRFKISIPADTRRIPDLGRFVCRGCNGAGPFLRPS